MLAFDSFQSYSILLIQLIHSSHFLPGHDHQNQSNSNHGRLNPPEAVSDFVQNFFLLVRFLGVRFIQQFQAQVVCRLLRSQTFLFVGVQFVLAKGEFIKQIRLSRLSQNIIHKYIHISYSFNRFKLSLNRLAKVCLLLRIIMIKSVLIYTKSSKCCARLYLHQCIIQQFLNMLQINRCITQAYF
ncbi:Hypothetical_protein [Hexamita inflata]|uniref:Hypothetical_protein n=1 Tax=Hexamita inflata TaxID=28002 RepID=A0AA86T9J5_9EUKA|nr:Hypothetical protein HINF_LOCUS688 [Hexamita inflata]CAI9913044.1 Hypothetical protein HINF_LOCUS689 [Hexamita inflata]